MTEYAEHRSRHLSQTAIALAAATSGVVVGATLLDYSFSGPEIAAGLTAASAIGAVSLRHSRRLAQPHILTPVPETGSGGLTIAAPRARELAAHPAGKSDAA